MSAWDERTIERFFDRLDRIAEALEQSDTRESDHRTAHAARSGDCTKIALELPGLQTGLVHQAISKAWDAGREYGRDEVRS